MQVLVNGITTGVLISVLALSFSVVYLPTRVFHIALGGVYTITPFIAWTLLQYYFPWYMAAAVAIIIGVGLSISCDLFNHAFLERRRASPGAHFVSSLGIYIVIVQIVILYWGSDPKAFRRGIDKVVEVGGTTIAYTQIIVTIISLITLLMFFIWLQNSQLGLRLRALADNPVELSLRGYNVYRYRLVAFAVSGILCSISSLLISYDIGFSPHGGLIALLLGVVAVIIGGRGTFLGPVIGGLLLGLSRAAVVWFLSARWQEAITFFLLALFLIFRSNGLLGKKVRLEADR